MSGDATQRCVRLANLSAEDYILARRTPVAVLHAVDGIESDEGVQITTTCNEMTVSMGPFIAESAPSDAVPCPAFDGTDDERARLHALVNQYAHGFTQDDLDLGYTEAVQHRIPTSAALPEHTAKPAPGSEGTHQGTPGPESHCGEPQSLRSSGGPGEEEGRQSSALCRLPATEVEDCW